MLITLVLLEFLIPAFNTGGRGVILRSITVRFWVWLVATIVIVGVIAGAYPAYMITRTTPIEALRSGKAVSGGGGLISQHDARPASLPSQFSCSGW